MGAFSNRTVQTRTTSNSTVLSLFASYVFKEDFARLSQVWDEDRIFVFHTTGELDKDRSRRPSGGNSATLWYRLPAKERTSASPELVPCF